MIKKISLMVWIIVILISSSLALAAENVDVKLTAPASVQSGSQFNIDVSLNSKGQNVKAITLYVTSENGKISFLSSTHSGEVWFSEKDPTQNNVVTLTGKSAWLFNIGPFGTIGDSSNADKKIFSLTATASDDDNIIIYNLNTDSKVSKLGLGSLTINAVTPATVAVSAASVACTANDWTVSWGSCNATCGGGTQTSTVTKKAASASCTGETDKPAATQSCNTQACALFTCTGAIPANAVLCPGDDQGLIVNTPITLTACGANKCEYTCNSGSELKGGACVPICTPNCAGKVCGSNGCGGSCGSCAQDKACIGGTCMSAPTCTDGIKNQEETGIDCGNLCPACVPASLKVETTDQDTYNLLTAIRDGLDALPGSASHLQKISAIASALSAYFK